MWRSENRGAGIPPAVARASCPRAGAGRSRDHGRDARATASSFLPCLSPWAFGPLRLMKIGWSIRRDALRRDVCARSPVCSNGAHTCRQKAPARLRHPCQLTEIAFSTLPCQTQPPMLGYHIRRSLSRTFFEASGGTWGRIGGSGSYVQDLGTLTQLTGKHLNQDELRIHTRPASKSTT